MRRLLEISRPLPRRLRRPVAMLSFLLPILLWCAVSYVPALWHPDMRISDAGSVDYFQDGMLIDRETFAAEHAHALQAHQPPPRGDPANPMYLPAPHEVARALVAAFTTPPGIRDEPWLHQSLLHSIRIIFLGFVISSAIGVPLGVFCGSLMMVSRLTEPFIEFFRYLPAPAFGALMVAILGIYDAPKIAIIVIGTLFQQVLVIANTTRLLDHGLVEAARTLGARRARLLFRVVVPAILPGVYRDQCILLGWAWTYLIVAELIGTSSGITWFITQQARYQHFANVYAAMIIIGIIGIGTDLLLALLGQRLFRGRQA